MPAYDLTNLDDCARKIIADRPLKQRQETHFAVIARHRGSPSRAQILERVKEMSK
jgi:hypothetical protein